MKADVSATICASVLSATGGADADATAPEANEAAPAGARTALCCVARTPDADMADMCTRWSSLTGIDACAEVGWGGGCCERISAWENCAARSASRARASAAAAACAAASRS